VRQPKDRQPKFKIGDNVLAYGQTAEIASEAWWDTMNDFRYEIDFKYGRLDRKYKGIYVVREGNLKQKFSAMPVVT
jgi:hypothetical protein